MTVDTFQQPGNALAQRTDPIGAVGSIVRWASDLSTAAQALNHIIDTAFVPDSFWPLPPGVSTRDFSTPKLKHPRESVEEYQGRRQLAIANSASAVVYGDAIGYAPPAALQSIYVVRGKPGMYAEAMVALTKSHGHQVEVEDLSDSRCVIRARRKTDADWQRFTFTMERARKAGYTRQNSKYENDPQAMLYARCASIACRSIAPDVLKGIAAVEDLADEPDSAAVQVTATRTVKPRTTRAITPAPATAQPGAQAAPAPAGDDLLGYEQRPAPTTPGPETGEQVTDPQLRKLGALFGDLDITGARSRERRLLVASRLAGRDLSSSKDLTKAEASHVIEALSGMNALDVSELCRDAEDAGATGTSALNPAPAATEQDDTDDLLDDDEQDFDASVEPGFGTE